MYDLISRQEAINTVLHYTIRIPDYMSEWGRKLTAAIKKDLMDDIEAIQPAQQWIPVKYRPITEEEKAYWLDRLWYDGWCELGDTMIFDCQMPDDGQKILVCAKCGNIWIDTHEDDGGLMGLEENGDWENIVAWMPLPEQYKEVKDD